MAGQTVVGAPPVPPGDGTTTAVKEPPPRRSAARNALEWVFVVAGAVAVAFVVKTFLFQAFWIPSASMEKTLVRGDRVLVNKLSYKLHDIHRGDVVVFKRPPTFTDNTVKDLIKRVVGLPGEQVSLRDHKVFINGRQLVEPYTSGLPTDVLPCGTFNVPGIDSLQGMLVPADTVLVMGDNRTNSSDGRCFGPLKKNLIVGRAFFVIWPPSKMGGL
ncbi:MAG: signal peptidase [Acidimicrobiales bacterium]|nr:signal peptidase [Acidimicrobiales bacterium]